MRRADQIRAAVKRMSLRQRRILLIDIDTRFDLPCAQGFRQRLRIDDRTAGCIDEDCSLFHKSDLLPADQAACLLCQRRMHGDNIRLCTDFIKAL